MGSTQPMITKDHVQERVNEEMVGPKTRLQRSIGSDNQNVMWVAEMYVRFYFSVLWDLLGKIDTVQLKARRRFLPFTPPKVIEV